MTHLLSQHIPIHIVKLSEDEGVNASSLTTSATWNLKFSFLYCSCYTADSYHGVSMETIKLN